VDSFILFEKTPKENILCRKKKIKKEIAVEIVASEDK
jgi:hypothetical protein